MKETFNLDLNSDPKINTTRSNTCIDAVFRRELDTLQSLNYVSYSYS